MFPELGGLLLPLLEKLRPLPSHPPTSSSPPSLPKCSRSQALLMAVVKEQVLEIGGGDRADWQSLLSPPFSLFSMRLTLLVP